MSTPHSRSAAPRPACAILPHREREDHARVLAALDPALVVLRPNSLGELEALRAPLVRVLLHVDHGTAEEIGWLARILASRPGWTLFGTGPDPSCRAARALLALAQARWMPWPLDLQDFRTLARAPLQFQAVQGPEILAREHIELLTALVGSLEGAYALLLDRRGGDEQALASMAQSVRRLTHFARTLGSLFEPPARGRDEFDLVALLDEQLAVLSTGARTQPRLQTRTPGGPRSPRFPVCADRAVLARAFETLLQLARLCAGASGTVRVLYAPVEGGEFEVQLEFPSGPLAGLSAAALEDVRTLCTPLPQVWAADILAARVGVESQGGSVRIEAAPPAQVRLRVRLPVLAPPTPRAEMASAAASDATAVETSAAPHAAPPRAETAGTPLDPFA
ncbi:MAG: hypothetical protein FJ294_14285 [Planctomycetes bacterium]|nr:hypothetical protein [Planctomycetota bacterium]